MNAPLKKHGVKQNTENQQIDWQSHSIRVSYDPNYFDGVAHVEIYSKDRKPLPITNTGYKSHFFMIDKPPTMEVIISFIIDWLNEEAKKKHWQEHLTKANQLELF